MKRRLFFSALIGAAPGLAATKIHPNQVKFSTSNASREIEDSFTFTTSNTFGLSQIPLNGTIPDVYRNGLWQKSGSDYTLVGRTLTFPISDLATDDTLVCKYNY